MFNNFDEIEQSTEKFFEFRMPSWYLLSGHAGHTFFGGLASFRCFRETRDPLWSQRGEQSKERINTWMHQGSVWNFESKSFLLEAEECYSNGHMEKAQEYYESAISAAQRHRFIHEEALAYELAAHFNHNIGNTLMALKYYTCAHGAYLKWGAFFKVKTLYAFLQDRFRSVLPLATANVVKEMSAMQTIS